MTRRTPLSLAQCRIQARRVLKQLRSSAPEEAAAAAGRFRRLRSFAGRSIEELVGTPDRVRLKHALALIAEERGYPSWTELKAALEHAEWEGAAWYAQGMDVFLNRWFTTHQAARAERDEQGGYLLPYRNQYFICPPDAVRLLGLDPNDPDWERIGWDCARPGDREAFERLRTAATAATRLHVAKATSPE